MSEELRAAVREGRALLLDKPRGETPLGCIEGVRARRSDLAGAKIGYAGRLDPLASGLMIALVGGENREAERWRALDKEYEATVLLGVETDAWDALGLVTAVRGCGAEEVREERVREVVAGWVGSFAQPVPPFAAHRVRGKSLWAYARSGEEVPGAWPVYQRTVYGVRAERGDEYSGQRVLEGALERVSEVTRGDFRQGLLREKWAEALRGYEGRGFASVRMGVRCSSGTFVRALARDLGSAMGVPSVLWDLRRVRVGEFEVGEA